MFFAPFLACSHHSSLQRWVCTLRIKHSWEQLPLMCPTCAYLLTNQRSGRLGGFEATFRALTSEDKDLIAKILSEKQPQVVLFVKNIVDKHNQGTNACKCPRTWILLSSEKAKRRAGDCCRINISLIYIKWFCTCFSQSQSQKEAARKYRQTNALSALLALRLFFCCRFSLTHKATWLKRAKLKLAKGNRPRPPVTTADPHQQPAKKKKNRAFGNKSL